MRSLVITPVFMMLLAFSCSAQKIAAKDAAKHAGETIMICDKVYNTEVVSGSNTTLLYLGSQTGQYLTVLVKGPENPKIKWHPETDFKGRNVCVTGKMVDYNGNPAIYVTQPSQLKIDMSESTIKVPGGKE